MGFMDSFRDSYKIEKEKSNKRQQNSTYRTLNQQRSEWIIKFNSLPDSKLLEKLRSDSTTEDDKQVIETILSRRGYIKRSNGMFDRR